jgi:hypothetical protein
VMTELFVTVVGECRPRKESGCRNDGADCFSNAHGGAIPEVFWP